MKDDQTIEGRLVRATIPIAAHHDNTSQELVTVTVDKLRLCLMEHLRTLEKRKDWIAPLSLFLALIVVFPTTEFKTFLGIKADVWQAFFMMATGLSLLWLCRATVVALRAPTVEDLVLQITAKDTREPARADSATQVSRPPVALNPSSDIFSPGTRPTTGVGLAAAHRRAQSVMLNPGAPDTEDMVNTMWRLLFSVSRGGRVGKRILLLNNSEIGEGKNANEYSWRIAEDGTLEFLQNDGRVHSKFSLDRQAGRWISYKRPELFQKTSEQHLTLDV